MQDGHAGVVFEKTCTLEGETGFLVELDAGKPGVKIRRPGGGTIYGEIPGVGKVHGVSYGDTMWVENIVVESAERLQGNSVLLYEALLKEAPATKVFRGEPGSLNLEVLKRTGDINLTPRAKALSKLGFTKHEYDAANNVMISTKP